MEHLQLLKSSVYRKVLPASVLTVMLGLDLPHCKGAGITENDLPGSH